MKFKNRILLLLTLSILVIPFGGFSETSKPSAEKSTQEVWSHGGFDDFSKGKFENSGNNLYVNAKGEIEIINHFDVNNDGYVDILLANSHDQNERGPTWVYTVDQSSGENWKRQQLSSDSGWMSRVMDVDGDGYNDMVTVNPYNGVSAELLSHVYWGGAEGLEASRTDLPTTGAYDAAALDINRDGRLDLLFPSSWKDAHNPTVPRVIHVYIQGEDRTFRDEGENYGILATGAQGIAVGDLNNDGYSDIVLACFRVGKVDLNTESQIYWGTAEGVNIEKPVSLPTFGSYQVMLEDLNGDTNKDIVFFGSGQVRIYWNESGKFDETNPLIIKPVEYHTNANKSLVRGDIADIDGDGVQDLILATTHGVEIRSGDSLMEVKAAVAVENSHWVTAADLNDDQLPELIISKHFEDNEYKTESPIYWNGPDGFSDDRVSRVPTIGVIGNTAADLDGDGKPEVVFNNVMANHVYSVPTYIYLGNEEANYGVENRLELSTDSTDLALNADLDLDGYPDLVLTVPNGIRIYHGSPQGPSDDNYTDVPTGHYHNDLDIADFNKDGYLDILAVSMVLEFNDDPENSSIILYGSEDGYSMERTDRPKSFGFNGTIGDIDNDGYLDILFQDKRDLVLVYFGSAEGYSNQRTQEIPCRAASDSIKINLADLNQDGWLDMIVGMIGARLRLKDTFRIYWGSPKGYDPENIQELLGNYSARFTGIADYNKDGNLDLLVTAYSTPTSRVPPAQLFWGNGKTLDLEHPLNFPAYASGDVIQIDLNRDGWIDIVLACHRDDVGHQVDSLIYWNSPIGFHTKEPTRLPGLGPHGMYAYGHGNAYTRKPEEYYVSPPFELDRRKANQIHWKSEETDLLKLKFQLRWAKTKEKLDDAEWMGPAGNTSSYETSGEAIKQIPSNAKWLQYRATFISPYGCGSPKLKGVEIVLN